MIEMIPPADSAPYRAERFECHGVSTRLPPQVLDTEVLRKPAPKATTTPDAPLTQVGRLLIAGVHVAVLVGIVAFITSHLVGAWTAPMQRAIPEIIAPAREMPSPAGGVFKPIRPFNRGDAVEAGELLGVIESTTHTAKLEALEEQQQQLYLRRLVLSGRRPSTTQTAQELRDVGERLVVVKGELSQLQAVKEEMSIRSPVTGRIAGSLSGSRPVRQHETVASVWADDDELLVEVTAPLPSIQWLIRKGRFSVTFQSPQSKYHVDVQPLPGTLKPTDGGIHARPGEIWAVIQCRPQFIPEPIAFPGAIGRL